MRRYESKPPPSVTFELDGQTFTTVNRASLLELSEVARLAGRAINDPAAAALVANFFRAVLGTADVYETRPDGPDDVPETLSLEPEEAADGVLAGALTLVRPSEYERFRAHVARHGTDAVTLMQIMSDLVEEEAEVPTRQPSPSRAGQTATASTYRVVSSSAVATLPLTPQRQAELEAEAARAREKAAQRSAAG